MNSSKTKAVWVGNKKYSDQIICSNMKLNWSNENYKKVNLNHLFLPEVNLVKMSVNELALVVQEFLLL
jgi:hypothetical protein